MRYSAIINLTRPESRRQKMSAADRAAQFSAFAALNGLEEQINETARFVDRKIELSEDEMETLNRKIRLLIEKTCGGSPQIKAVWFVLDSQKDGGSYVTKIGAVKRVDEVFRKILFADGTQIHIPDIFDFEIIE